MVLQEPYRRREAVQEFEFPGRQLHDVCAGPYAVLDPCDDAAFSAITHGLHGRVGRPGALGGWPSAIGSDADRGVSLVQGSGPLSGGVWLVGSVDWLVLFDATTGPANQLSQRQHVAPSAGVWTRLSVRSHQSDLIRRNAHREEQQRRWAGELYAQHWQQRGNVDGHYADCAPSSVPPSVP